MWNLSGATPTNVAGQPSYTVRISPKHDGGLLGAAEVAWDAAHGVPLRAAVYAQGETTPVLELEATDISFGKVAAADVDGRAAGGRQDRRAQPAGAATDAQRRPPRRTGLAAVQQQVGFTARRARHARRPAAPGRSGSCASATDNGALVTYGAGPRRDRRARSARPTPQAQAAAAGAACACRRSRSTAPPARSSPRRSARVVTFDRGGVHYTVARLGAAARRPRPRRGASA